MKNKKIINTVNLIFLFVSVLVWIYDIIAAFNYDSILFEFNSNRNVNVGIFVMLFLLFLVVFILKTENQVSLCLFTISGISLYLLCNKLIPYITILEYESYNIIEIIYGLIFLLSFLISGVSIILDIIIS